MTDFVQVKNWSDFQQYKDRDPKWIKLYRDVLVDYEFDQLTEVQQIHLVKIWLLASKLNNMIPNDPDWVGRQIGAKSKVNIKQLLTSGYLCLYESVQDCTELYLETETERETERDTSAKTPTCPHSEIIDLYHEYLPMLPRVLESVWNESGGALDLRQRWKENPEHQDLDFWRGFFSAVATNDWWINPEKWGKASLRWLIKKKRFYEVVQYWANLEQAA